MYVCLCLFLCVCACECARAANSAVSCPEIMATTVKYRMEGSVCACVRAHALARAHMCVLASGECTPVCERKRQYIFLLRKSHPTKKKKNELRQNLHTIVDE